MKNLMSRFVIAALALGTSLTVSAREIDGGWNVGGPVVRYISWCTQNVLTAEGPQGQSIPKFNCTAYGRVCKEQETKQGPYLFVSASCVAPTVAPRSGNREIDNGWDVGGPVMRYLSWCDRNVLTAQGPQGQAVPQYNCTAYGRVCKQQESKQGPYLFVSATCAAPTSR